MTTHFTAQVILTTLEDGQESSRIVTFGHRDPRATLALVPGLDMARQAVLDAVTHMDQILGSVEKNLAKQEEEQS